MQTYWSHGSCVRGGGKPCDSPHWTRKTRRELAQPGFTVANPEVRSGSLGASTVSFFTLTFCQKPVKNTGKSPMDSHSVTFEHPLIRNLVTAAPEDLRCPSFFSLHRSTPTRSLTSPVRLDKCSRATAIPRVKLNHTLSFQDLEGERRGIKVSTSTISTLHGHRLLPGRHRRAHQIRCEHAPIDRKERGLGTGTRFAGTAVSG